MPTPNATTSEAFVKPPKPYPDFPLFPHASGQWAKKIRGKLHYFGKWDDPDAALKAYVDQKDAWHAGRAPRSESDAATVQDVCNAFRNYKKSLRDAGELSSRTWEGYEDAARLIIAAFGKARLVEDLGPDDFAALRKSLARNRGPKWLGNTIQNIRCLFRYAHESRLITSPVAFGPGFKRPSKKVLRVHRARQGSNLFTAEEVRNLIDAAGPAMRAMILLGINCGFGNSDCGNLPLSALNLEAAVIDFPRPKTGIPRRCPLWPETVATIREALAGQPEAKQKEHAALVFITKHGRSWSKEIADSPITKEMRKLLKKLGINGRKGLGFYTLRHTFRTVADESKDQPAVEFIMGYEVPHMNAVYRETISDDRLRAVADHVRQWLFARAEEKPAPHEDKPAGLDRELILQFWRSGIGKANGVQLTLMLRLMEKGWKNPWYSRRAVWLRMPNADASGQRCQQSREILGKAIRITIAGRILRGW